MLSLVLGCRDPHRLARQMKMRKRTRSFVGAEVVTMIVAECTIEFEVEVGNMS